MYPFYRSNSSSSHTATKTDNAKTHPTLKPNTEKSMSLKSLYFMDRSPFDLRIILILSISSSLPRQRADSSVILVDSWSQVHVVT